MGWACDVEPGAWIASRLAPFGTGGASVVPSGFEHYARVFHPAGSDGSRRAGTPWSVVAGWSGATLTSTSTWLDVALPERRPAAARPWDGHGPDTGAYPAETSAALVHVLRNHTVDPSDVWAGVWEGWGDLPVPSDVPRLHHPARAYVLRHGTLVDTSRIDTESPWPSRPPNLWWPADRSWCVASEIDADCTYVGGSESLIGEVIAHPGVEAIEVAPVASSLVLTAPAWLADLLADAETRLRAGEAVELELSRGTVWASLRAPRRGRTGELTTVSVDDHGARRSGSMPLGSAGDVDGQLSAALLWAAYELTT